VNGMLMLRKIGFLALIGFLVLVLGGPVLGLVAALFSLGLAIASVVLPFALIGFIAWFVYQLLFGHGTETWHQVRGSAQHFYQDVAAGPLDACKQGCKNAINLGQATGRRAHGLGYFVGRLLSLPFRITMALGRGLFRVARGLADRTRFTFRFVGAIFTETLCGAFVGALLGALGVTHGQDTEIAILLGAIGGALLGILLGVTRPAAVHASPATGEAPAM